MLKILNVLEAKDLGDAWYQALNLVMEKGRRYLVTKGSYAGTYRSGAPVIIEIQYPGSRPLFPIMPEGSNIPPPTAQQDIEDYCQYLVNPQKAENEHYTYAEDLHWQIEWVIKHFAEGGHGNNHCYMTVGRPETLYFYDRSVAYTERINVYDRVSGQMIRQREITNEWNVNPQNSPSSQCLRGIDVWIQDGRLHFWIYFRSWDLWGGFPVNLGGLQLVKEIMASEVGVKDGAMIVSCKDLHVYQHAWVVALMRLGKQEEKPDCRVCNGRETDIPYPGDVNIFCKKKGETSADVDTATGISPEVKKIIHGDDFCPEFEIG